jgi:hypothetical protein
MWNKVMDIFFGTLFGYFAEPVLNELVEDLDDAIESSTDKEESLPEEEHPEVHPMSYSPDLADSNMDDHLDLDDPEQIEGLPTENAFVDDWDDNDFDDSYDDSYEDYNDFGFIDLS